MQTGLLTQTYGVYSGTVSLTPTQPLHPGELVQVSATTGTMDTGGTTPDRPSVWQFWSGVDGGLGLFADSGQALGSAEGSDVALGDVDGDGDLDAFVANSDYPYGQANTMWLNDGTGIFTDSGQSLGNGVSFGVALGDLDGDGDLDAFVANAQWLTGQANEVWLNDGAGVFTQTQSLGGEESFGVALGDVDGDGDLDAFVANSGANEVWLNDGAGTFADSGQRLGSEYSFGVALGDVDDDRDLDAFVVNYYGQSNRVWLNDGTGVFTDSGLGLGDEYSYNVALGDVDGDGDLDAFVANSRPCDTLWLNAGGGTFFRSGQSLSCANSRDAALGDVDNDDDLDIFIANYGEANEVWLNGGTGHFGDSGQSLGGAPSRGLALGDVDGDGNLDAFVANYGQADRVWLQVDLLLAKTVSRFTVAPGEALTYTLTYTNHGASLATSVLITDVVPAELTDVGFISGGPAITPTGSVSYTWQVEDLPPGEWGVITVTGVVSPGLPFGSVFTNTAIIASPLIGTQDSVVVAVSLRVIATYPEAGAIAVSQDTLISATFNGAVDSGTVDASTFPVWGAQTGRYTGTYSFPNSDIVQFDPAAPFKPGEKVVVVASSGVQGGGGGAIASHAWEFRAATEESLGRFAPTGQSLGSAYGHDVALGDLDGDGDLDAFVANLWSNAVWLNNGIGIFTNSGQDFGTVSSYDVALGDLDGDGDLDAFVANSSANEVWLNDGTGLFVDSGQSLGSAVRVGFGVALGDVDGDGDLDAFVANIWAANELWLNDGSGTFVDSGQGLGSLDSYGIALGDVDGDGDLDAFLANYYGQADQVWLNNGGVQGGMLGTFVDSGQSLGSSSGHDVALGDVDGDGDLDAFVANYGSANEVWLNDGAGGFTDSGQSPGGGYSLGVELGDLEGDGDLDAFLANCSSRANEVWLNDGAGGFSDSAQRLGSESSQGVALGDVDGDGDLDAFVANSGADKVWLNLNYAVYLPLALR
jgi:uncharacterized repeat protein (TIGR01451 family)